MGDTPTPRPTYVLVRGNYDDHGDQVPPRGLNQVLPWNPAWPENRHRTRAVAVRFEESRSPRVCS